jgi:hypothetical protein
VKIRSEFMAVKAGEPVGGRSEEQRRKSVLSRAVFRMIQVKLALPGRTETRCTVDVASVSLFNHHRSFLLFSVPCFCWRSFPFDWVSSIQARACLPFSILYIYSRRSERLHRQVRQPRDCFLLEVEMPSGHWQLYAGDILSRLTAYSGLLKEEQVEIGGI